MFIIWLFQNHPHYLSAYWKGVTQQLNPQAPWDMSTLKYLLYGQYIGEMLNYVVIWRDALSCWTICKHWLPSDLCIEIVLLPINILRSWDLFLFLTKADILQKPEATLSWFLLPRKYLPLVSISMGQTNSDCKAIRPVKI